MASGPPAPPATATNTGGLPGKVIPPEMECEAIDHLMKLLIRTQAAVKDVYKKAPALRTQDLPNGPLVAVLSPKSTGAAPALLANLQQPPPFPVLASPADTIQLVTAQLGKWLENQRQRLPAGVTLTATPLTEFFQQLEFKIEVGQVFHVHILVTYSLAPEDKAGLPFRLQDIHVLGSSELITPSFTSEYAVFKRLSRLFMVHFSTLAVVGHGDALAEFMGWLPAYLGLFVEPCHGCQCILRMNEEDMFLYPPILRLTGPEGLSTVPYHLGCS
ncbi:hypothetical protein BJ085DRAFT_38232 [Dimargaris cristalligena]|uniref:Uncharacterized protein n=1 Tax=Dimargaris cristalligena TaxID=215637 RepID=A0A4P9ZVI6_9FUNG|nr:hypothetical protein BJ085DRAFT_38232 [Dimargaris cristalligena]|eukprot:RKP37593.1 hypothetical protein BJ085DRAFT_38232 [Dimargaris cristalligena]